MTTSGRQQADVLAELLFEAGVRDIFTLCGNHLLDAYRALVDRGITLVGVRSEGAAVAAADGYARSTRRLGVALVTGGPGHTNGITALVTAHTASSPVLLLSGSSDTRHRGGGAHQEIDQVAGVAAYTKWADEVASAEQLVPMLAEAIKQARTTPTGATHLSLPLNVLAARAAGQETTAEVGPALSVQQPPDPAPADVTAMAAVLAAAQRPIALLGAGAYFEQAEHAVAEFCAARCIPVFTLDSARGALPDDDEWCFGYPDPEMNPAAAVVAQADAVLLFGHRLDFRFGYGGSFASTARIVEINPDPAALGVVDERVLQVPGATALVLAQVLAGLSAENVAGGWIDSIRASNTPVEAERRHSVHPVDQADGALDPEAVAEVLRAHIPHAASVAFDSGDFVQWCRAILAASGPGQWLRPGRMSTCGEGLPLAVGAAVGRAKPSVVIVGDGSLGYHVAELETAARYALPLLCVVGNNQAWGLELNLQNAMYAERYAEVSTLGAVDYPAVAAGFGIEGYHARSLAQLAQHVDDFAARPRPMLVEVPVTLRPSPVTRAIIERGSV